MAYCTWGHNSKQMELYHDEEWGVPVHDDQKQFEFLSLEVMQCGISWGIVMKKREIIRNCFDNFDYEKVARYTEQDIARIMNVDNMIHNQKKIEAIITNARAFLKIREKYGTFSDYLWSFTDKKTILYNKHGDGWIPDSNGLSDIISKDLKREGFKFTGTVVIYSHMQACGMINDHDKNCPCYKKLIENYPTIKKKRYLEKNIEHFL